MSKNILWIEDESSLLNNMLRVLKNNDFQIDNVRTKNDAIQIIDKQLDLYCLIILDIIIPSGEDVTELSFHDVIRRINEFEGLHVLEYLKEKNKNNIPIVIITIISQNELRERIRKYLDDESYNLKDVMYKSILRQQEILSRINNAIAK
jgi:CheY-like chemotaxis protein